MENLLRIKHSYDGLLNLHDIPLIKFSTSYIWNKAIGKKHTEINFLDI